MEPRAEGCGGASFKGRTDGTWGWRPEAGDELGDLEKAGENSYSTASGSDHTSILPADPQGCLGGHLLPVPSDNSGLLLIFSPSS